MTRHIWLVLLLFPAPLWAGNWVICDYKVETTEVNFNKDEITVRLIKAARGNPDACPKPDRTYSFTPEAPDYQSMLPRKKWPKLHQKTFLRYRYLDGACKLRPVCRIEHFSIMKSVNM